MFKIGLENRDFLQITTFLYSGRWQKKKKKTSCICWLVQLVSALTIFFLCCGALASALINEVFKKCTTLYELEEKDALCDETSTSKGISGYIKNF